MAPTILITIDEAARRLSLAPRTIYRLINRGHIESVHIGRAVRVVESSLDSYITSLRHSPF
jgi:excisionase family DNA binding protein